MIPAIVTTRILVVFEFNRQNIQKLPFFILINGVYIKLIKFLSFVPRQPSHPIPNP